MLTVTKDIVLSTNGDESYIHLYAKQYDSKTRYLRVKLVDSKGNQVSFEDTQDTTYQCYLRAVKPDKTQVLTPCTVDSSGLIVCPLSEQFLACAGVVKADVAIYSNNEELLSSSVFDVEVEKSSYDESAVESDNDFSALTAALAETHSAMIQAIESATTVTELNHKRAVKFWVGSKAEFDELISKDNYTVYIITDDTELEDILSTLDDLQRQIDELKGV